MTRGVWLLIIFGVILILALWLGIVCAKVNADYVPGGSMIVRPPAQPPTATAVGPAGPLIENQTGRAAETEVPSAASARRLPRGADAKPAQARPVCLFDALRQVESAGNDYAVGDGGRSKGPYQCGRAAWADGGGNPADYDRLVWNRAACERVMVGYWKRYGCETDEQRARCWNGGPRGAEKKATLKYWQRVNVEIVGQCGPEECVK
ncbi:hypothetical protein ES708_02738 [subsurface metagenome]